MCVCMYVYMYVNEEKTFNGALNTFYLRIYGVGHMAKKHSD